MELDAFYLKLDDTDNAKENYLKVIQAQPENKRDLERFVKKAFNEIKSYSKSFGDIYLTPCSVEDYSQKYGLLFEGLCASNNIQTREKVRYETKFRLVDVLNKEYNSIFKVENKTAFMLDFSQMDSPKIGFHSFLDLLTEGYSSLDKNGFDVKLRVTPSEITDPFFEVFYLTNRDNLFHDPFTNATFYMNSAPKLSNRQRLALLLKSFDQVFLNDSLNNHNQLFLKELQNRFSKKILSDEGFNNLEFVEQGTNISEVAISSNVTIINEDYAFIAVQLSDMNFDKACSQIFFADAFEGAYNTIFIGVINNIVQYLIENEITPYVSPFVLSLHPWLPVKESHKIEKPKIPPDKEEYFSPEYAIDINAYLDDFEGYDYYSDDEDDD